ncbi:MAG: uroporphyrinogen decarboxylase family protein [Candidatus Tectomicrobia bacterium]|uniref:Uroporphyrinogen decarboxylase family protein n=1 Tax=Tectimicrobiota bacterium TaxID=2528274 RepID=A0A932CNQ1_UNCTE|nr:uroporphyrinogen decarboxylase family protein [Candidatus Tectomicrobia bacterium]
MSAKGRRKGGPLLGMISARLTNTTILENVLDGERMAQTIAEVVERFGLESVPLTFADFSAMAECCGCEIYFQQDVLPMVVSHPVKTREDIAGLRIPDPQEDGRLPELIRSARRLAARFPTLSKSVTCFGPFTLAGHLSGVEYLSRKTLSDPDYVNELLDFCVAAILDYAGAMVEVGANLIFLGDPTASLLSPKAYREFAGAATRKLVEQLKVPALLHICGNTTHLIEEMCATGVKGLSLDAPVHLPSAARRIPPQISLMGNLSPTGVLLTGTPQEVRQATWQLMDEMKEFPNYRVASGCDLPPETPVENILAMMEAIREYAG